MLLAIELINAQNCYPSPLRAQGSKCSCWSKEINLESRVSVHVAKAFTQNEEINYLKTTIKPQSSLQLTSQNFFLWLCLRITCLFVLQITAGMKWEHGTRAPWRLSRNVWSWNLCHEDLLFPFPVTTHNNPTRPTLSKHFLKLFEWRETFGFIRLYAVMLIWNLLICLIGWKQREGARLALCEHAEAN